ncbi:MAG: NAD(P)-dependent oxidoreductase [Phycisphaerae bacterium]|nr:NAD(P)-dependent oxidoreductase [Phycisphaerae bacterium]
MTDQRIAFIGTGIMGAPMARNLLRAGYAVIVHNRTPSKAEALRADGASVADSPAQAAEQADVVISCLPDSPDVEAVWLAAEGVVAAMRKNTLGIDMSTIAPSTARKVADAVLRAGGAFLDAPISGGDVGAVNATLSIMAGGPDEAFKRAEPIFRAMGKTIVHCGPNGMGQQTKLCNQVICVLNILAAAEAITMARKAGLDLARMLEATTAGAARSWMLENLGPKMAAGNDDPGFLIDLQQKDLRLVQETARELNLPLPGTALVSQLFAANQAAGEGRLGTQAIVKTLERLAGLRNLPDR